MILQSSGQNQELGTFGVSFAGDVWLWLFCSGVLMNGFSLMSLPEVNLEGYEMVSAALLTRHKSCQGLT